MARLALNIERVISVPAQRLESGTKAAARNPTVVLAARRAAPRLEACGGASHVSVSQRADSPERIARNLRHQAADRRGACAPGLRLWSALPQQPHSARTPAEIRRNSVLHILLPPRCIGKNCGWPLRKVREDLLVQILPCDDIAAIATDIDAGFLASNEPPEQVLVGLDFLRIRGIAIIPVLSTGTGCHGVCGRQD